MTSQKSQNKITLLSLMREDLRHRRWMVVLSSFVQLIFGPVMALMRFTDIEAQSYYYYGEDFIQNKYRAMQRAVESMTQSYLPVMMAIIAVVGALIVGIGGYRHLFNRRMTDMVNSVPVTRGKQFDSIYYNNWLIWFVPQLVSTILTTFIMLVRTASYGLAPTVLRSAFFVLIGSAFAFACMMHLTILAVVLSGTIFNAFLNIAFIGFDVIVAFVIVSGLCSTNFRTFVSLPISMEQICWTSAPLSGGYLGACISAGLTGDAYKEAVNSFGSEATFWFVLIATMIVAILNLIIAYSLYIKRKSEESENGVSSKAYRMFIRCFNSVLGGLFIAILIDELFYIDERALVVWMIIFAAIGCGLVFGIIDTAHTKSFRGFFANWKQMIVLVLITEAILAVFVYDLTGFDKRIVPESNIETAMIDAYLYGMGADGSGYVKDPENDGMIMEKYMLPDYDQSDNYVEIPADVAYKLMTAERVFWKFGQANIYNPLTGQTERVPENEWGYQSEYLNIFIEKKNGTEFKRVYQIVNRDALEEVIALPGYMEKAYPLRTGELGYPVAIRITDFETGNETEIPADRMQELFDATIEDFKANYSLDYLEMTNSYDVYCLECRYYVTIPDGEEGDYWTYSMNLYVTEEDVRSIEILEELGFEDYKYNPYQVTYDEYEYGYY